MGYGLGGGEILLVIVVALLIWGPEKIPEIARNLGRIMNTLTKARTGLVAQVKAEMNRMEEEEKAEKEKKAAESSPEPEPETSDDSGLSEQEKAIKESANYLSPEEEQDKQ